MGIIQALMARKWILYGFLAALILGIVYVVLPTKPNQTASAAETSPNPGVFSGNLALDITVIDREGNEVSLSDFRGRPVFLNFFATWCGPCKYEMPFMEKIWREYQEMGSDLVYLVVDVAENQETVEKYYRDNFYTMPYFLDPNGKAFLNTSQRHTRKHLHQQRWCDRSPLQRSAAGSYHPQEYRTHNQVSL